MTAHIRICVDQDHRRAHFHRLDGRRQARRARTNHHHISLFIPLRGPGLRLRVFEAQHAQRRRARARRSRLDQIPPRKRFFFPPIFFHVTHPLHAVIVNALKTTRP